MDSGVEIEVPATVNDIEGALADAEGKGVQLVDKKSRKGAEGLDIGFLHPRFTLGVLTELCEDNNHLV